MSNQVILIGRISSLFTYDHTLYGEKYYRVSVSVKRTSGYTDVIPVVVSERLITTNEAYIDKYVHIIGNFRSYKKRDGDRAKLILFVFAKSMVFTQEDNVNDVFLEGTIHKPPVHRYTPLGREITDILLAVTRQYNKVDYIPCICWECMAMYVNKFNAGDSIRVAGRIQSREYVKNGETKTAYELSVNIIESV